MNPLIVDRRKHERLELRLRVRFCANERMPAIQCVTENVSGGGFYCLSPTAFAADEQKEVQLLLPTRGYGRTGEDVNIQCTVRVVRVHTVGSGRGFGVAC